MMALPGPGISESLLQQIPSLVEKDSGHVLLHGVALSAWMHEAFPLQCAAPQTDTFARVTNPRTPDEWMQTGEIQSQGLPILEMMKHLAKGLSRYTSMGKSCLGHRTNTDPPPLWANHPCPPRSCPCLYIE